MEYILEMIDIEKSFPGVKACKKCQLKLKKGEVHVLLGENGAGKSTLVKILVGIEQKDAGIITYNGNEVNFQNYKQAEEKGIGIIYQEFNLIPKLSVCENIFIGKQPVKNGFVDWKKMQQNAKKILDSLQVNIDVNTKVEDLGVAQQQMVEIAKVLSIDANIIIMDEPTAALTDKEIDKLFETIRRLKSQGVSIIYISHRMEEIAKIGDRATIMRDGAYISTVDFGKVTMDEIINLIVGRNLDEKYPREIHKPGKLILKASHVKAGSMVKDVSFVAYEGEIIGFAGLMGAGRTETMRAVFGADVMESGEVFIDGKKVNIKSPQIAIENGIGFLTEDRKNQGLVLNMSVKENITLTNLNKLIHRGIFLNLKKENDLSKKLSDELTVKTPSVNQKVKNLSGGNQQKVVLAKWVNRDCRILIFDEPTRGIDVGAKSEIYKLMNKLCKKGISIIMISSELPEILGMSDRIYIMHEGRVTGALNYKDADQNILMKYAINELNDFEEKSILIKEREDVNESVIG